MTRKKKGKLASGGKKEERLAILLERKKVDWQVTGKKERRLASN